MKTLFIAEIGNNHNGCLDRAIALVDVVKECNLQIAKFQMRNMDQLYRDRDVEDLGVEYTKDLLGKFNLSFAQHKKISNYCKSIGVEYMCTPWDLLSIDQMEEIGVKKYKVASADFNNIMLLQKLVKTRKPLYLSTGMSKVDEIIGITKFLNNKKTDFTLLHCNSTYPAPFFDIELNFLKKLKLYILK